MSRYNPFYFIGQALKGLWRNNVMTIASVLILSSCLIVLGSFALLVADLNLNLDEMGLMNEIAIYLDTDVTDERVEEIDQYAARTGQCGQCDLYFQGAGPARDEGGLRAVQQSF